MKNLTKQVCTFEQAKRLKELGVEQDSLWYWNTIYLGEPKISLYNAHSKDDDFFKSGMDSYKDIDISCHREPYYSAYTVAELGEMLPDETINGGMVDRHNENEYYCYTRTGDKFYTCRRNIDGDAALWNDDLEYDTPPTEAQCRADILIYLLENKLI